MDQQIEFTPEQINSMNMNGVAYQEKLKNQHRELDKIAENISENWHGQKAAVTVKALLDSSKDFKFVSNDIGPLNDLIRATVNAVREVHGDI